MFRDSANMEGVHGARGLLPLQLVRCEAEMHHTQLLETFDGNKQYIRPFDVYICVCVPPSLLFSVFENGALFIYCTPYLTAVIFA
jgi:hypothetical protein